MLFVAGGYGSEVLDFVEEAFNSVTVSIEELGEGRNLFARRHWLYIGPGTACFQARPHGIAVVSAVCEQDLSLAQIVQHICR